MANWFQRGKEGIKTSKRLNAEASAKREAKKNEVRRLWLKNDSSTKFSFVDTPDFFVREHNLKLAGAYHNYFTCIGEDDTCPPCEDGDNPSWILVGTVINHSKWKDREGTEHTNQKQLIVLKSRARDKVIRQIEKRKDLRLCVFEAHRGSSQTECATGEDFDYLGKLSKEKAIKLVPDGTKPKEFWTPYDYEKIFAPKSAKVLRKIVGGDDPVGGEDDDLPFDLDDDTLDADAVTEIEETSSDDLSIDDLI